MSINTANEHQITLDELHLSIREYNVLKRMGIVTVDDLMKYSYSDLIARLRFRVGGLPHAFLDRINKKLQTVGLELRDN